MLMDAIRKEMFEAKKVKDTVKANLLSTLYSEIFTISKSGKELTGEDEIKIIRKFLKNIDETLGFEITEDVKSKLLTEKAILEAYLPKQMSIDEIEKIISLMIAEGKTIKDIMPHFKQNFAGLYDGKTVSDAVKKHSA